MEGLAVLAMLVVLGIPVSIIVLFVMVSGLKGRIRTLEDELEKVGQPVAHEVAPPAAPVAFSPAAPADAPRPEPATPAAPAMPEPAADPQPAKASPWDRARGEGAASDVPEPALTSASQNRPLVLRADRMGALADWLKGNWIYAVSALSLALAGVFFVQYGVENGLLPPKLRVLAALVFGAGLIAAGEWLRRRYGDEGTTTTVNLPSVFSGAGLVTLFAAVLAARQLYGLIGPGPAFAGLLATAALAVALGWFSGPLLVAVGLIGAAAVPFVVGGASETVDWLYAYFALIAAVGLSVDAVRRWAWVSVLALVLGYAGGVFLESDAGSEAGWIGQLLVLALLAITVPELRLIPAQAGPAILPALALRGASGWPPFPARLAAGATLASTIGLFLMAQTSADTAMLALAVLAAMVLAFLLWAEGAEGLADLSLPPVLAFVAALAVQGLGYGSLVNEFQSMAIDVRPPESAPSLTVSLVLAMAAMMSLAFAYRALRPRRWGVVQALCAVLAAPLSVAVLELLWLPALVLGPYPWALHIIGLAALMTALALRFAKVDAPQMRRAAYAALSALSLIALALFLLTTKTALTLALSVLVVAAAALDRRFRLPEMSLFLQAGAVVLGYRLVIDPGLDWAMSAALWQVLVAFGGAIAAMIVALSLLRPLERPMAKAVAESAAAGLAAILANVLITRWLDTTESYVLETHYALTLNSLPWLVLMLSQLYRARLGGPLAWLRRGLAVLGGLFSGLGLGAAATHGNPLFTHSAEQTGALVRGPLVLDSLLMAYGVPALILLAAAWKMPGLERRLRLAGLGIGAAFLALYTGLEIRRFWQGDWLGGADVLQGEQYTYTLALMLVGAATLYQSIAKRSDTLRRIAMALIGVIILKVFLVDASSLSGLTRVASLAGLGLSLAGLAWLNRWAASRP